MSLVAEEKILVVPTALFHSLGHFQGICTDVEPYLAKLLDPANIQFRPRDEMEQDPSFKQLIPYCLFRHGDTLFRYTRGNAQGEKRLHAKKSVGVGGHISAEDVGKGPSLYREGMRREIEEEVHIRLRDTELHRAVEALPERQEAVIRLRYGMDGGEDPLSYREIAARLGISHEAARRLEREALKNLAVAREVSALAEAV